MRVKTKEHIFYRISQKVKVLHTMQVREVQCSGKKNTTEDSNNVVSAQNHHYWLQYKLLFLYYIIQNQPFNCSRKKSRDNGFCILTPASNHY